jgi:hypothetical protein
VSPVHRSAWLLSHFSGCVAIVLLVVGVTLRVTGMLENSPLMPPNYRRVANPKALRNSSSPLAQGNPRQLLAASLDGRTSGAFDRLVADIESDLGGSDQLSVIECVFVEGFVSLDVYPPSIFAAIALVGFSISL